MTLGATHHKRCGNSFLLVKIKPITPPKVVFEGFPDNILPLTVKTCLPWQVNQVTIDYIERRAEDTTQKYARFIGIQTL
jgi:hypothetical protein